MSIIQFITPIFYLLFFIGFGSAYILRDRFEMRKLAVVCFFICLIIVSSVSYTVFPMIDFRKYSGTLDKEVTHHEIRMVDEGGNEIVLDARAIEPMRYSGIRTKIIRKYMNNKSPKERLETFSYIYCEANRYRTNIEKKSISPIKMFDFPRHSKGKKWTAKELYQYESFTGIRVYQVDRRFTDNNTNIVHESEKIIYEITENQLPTNKQIC